MIKQWISLFAALFVSLQVSAAPILVGDEGSWYDIFPTPSSAPLDVSAGGAHTYWWPYSFFVPSGETRPIHITNAFVQIQGPQTYGQGVVAVVVESPAKSGVWKNPLVEALDEVNGGRDEQLLNPGVILSSGDWLCLQVVWNAQSAKTSVWQGPSATTYRRVSIGINYRWY